MRFLLISSKKDKASVNFKEQLFKKYLFTNLSITTITSYYKLNLISKNEIYFLEIEELHIFLKEDFFQKENFFFNQVIFLSKHSTLSEIKPKCMTVHAIGNWGKAELGGKDFTVVKTDPVLIRTLLLNLKENKPKEIKEYEVKQEATHHGPYLEVSTIFYEIGSIDSDWENSFLASYMIDILINTIKEYDKDKIIKENDWIPSVGIGGSHYCTKFNRYTFDRSKKYCFGHVIANYALKDITDKIIEDAKNKSFAEKIIKEENL